MAGDRKDYTGIIEIKDVEVLNTGLATLGFNTPRSNQTPFSICHEVAVAQTWETIKTVTTGKTAYVTQVIFACIGGLSEEHYIGHNSSADLAIAAGAVATVVITLATPIKYSSGTNIQGYGQSINDCITIVGWEE